MSGSSAKGISNGAGTVGFLGLISIFYSGVWVGCLDMFTLDTFSCAVRPCHDFSLFMDYVLLLCCIQYEIMSVIYIMSLM
jgi:hypothetical protein